VVFAAESRSFACDQALPPALVAAQGAWLKDEDGHDILDLSRAIWPTSWAIIRTKQFALALKKLTHLFSHAKLLINELRRNFRKEAFQTACLTKP
jgi:hypothetical protein